MYWLFRRLRPRTVDRMFRVGQLLSAAAYSIGHGGNDAQKTMGVIIAVLVAGGMLPATERDGRRPYVGHRRVATSAMALGTAIGGWRIVKTMGMGSRKLKPGRRVLRRDRRARSRCSARPRSRSRSRRRTRSPARSSASARSTKLRGIRWGLATRIVWAWIFTIPASAGVGILLVKLFQLIGVI